MPASSSSDIERRIIELAFTPWDGLPEQLRRLGFSVELEDGVLNVRNEQFGVLLLDCDPINKSVLLASIICGSAWGHFFPELLEKVDVEWKRQRQTKKSDP